jgi:Effector Associated Constant Component 1
MGEVVDVEVRVVGDSRSGAESLLEWLVREDAFRGRVQRSSGSVRPETLGTSLDALTVALGSGGALAVLARSLRGWLMQPRRATVRLELSRASGQRLKLHAENVRNLKELETLLEHLLQERGER